MLFPVVILAGGFARRLGSLTRTTPKSLLSVAGKPFIEWQLEYLASQGVTKVVLCLGHLGDQIASRIGDGQQYGLNVDYSFDGSIPLGTGGSIAAALQMLSENFFVLYGDSYLPVNYNAIQDAFLAANKPALMTVYKNNGDLDRSNLVFADGCILLYDKTNLTPDMIFIDYGLGVLSRQIIENYGTSVSFDLADLYNHLSKIGLLAGFEVKERFYEIGSSSGIRDTEKFLSARS